MDNRRWVIALNKNTGRRMEFAMCDVNNVAFYQAKYTFNGYDVKVLTADEVEKFADNEKQNGIISRLIFLKANATVSSSNSN